MRPLRAAENARQLRHTGTPARVRAVAELNTWRYTSKAARRAVLLALADVHRLVYRGTVAGHPGAIAVTVDSGDWRDVLVLDRTSGVVLAYEQLLLHNGHQLGVRTPYSNIRTVYTDRGRKTQAGSAPSQYSTGPAVKRPPHASGTAQPEACGTCYRPLTDVAPAPGIP